jgi:predicted naringenin-chalcone synthase
MSYILDISTEVPEYGSTKNDLIEFYSKTLESNDTNSFKKKLSLLSEKTKISTRYSCIPDFNGNKYELFIDGNYKPSVEKRMALYKEKVMPLAVKAINKLLLQTNIVSNDITHIITVSCTGLFSPGLEFLVSEHYGLQHTEKIAVNFLGCYAAIKALKHAHYIAQANPKACILIVSVELCTLHFYPSDSDEDIVSNLLFADGAAAVIVCGNESSHIKNKVVLNIDSIGSAYIPNTLDLMTWDISSTAFRMHLSKKIVNSIKENIQPVVTNFFKQNAINTDYWAIHPGGIRIIEAVKESLNLSEGNVEDSIHILQQYGNMSSPTILFILHKIFNKIKDTGPAINGESKKIFSCAFGPGISIEMISLSAIDTTTKSEVKYATEKYAFQI